MAPPDLGQCQPVGFSLIWDILEPKSVLQESSSDGESGRKRGPLFSTDHADKLATAPKADNELFQESLSTS